MRLALTATAILGAAYLGGCSRGPGERGPMPPADKPPGMRRFNYLVCDGGPHLLLPWGLSAHWKGLTSPGDALNPASAYGKACAAVAGQRLSLLPVGSGHAIVLQDPPMSAWGRSPEGWIDLYYLEAWKDA